MGGPGSGRKQTKFPEDRIGHSQKSETQEDPRYLPRSTAQRLPVPAIPEPSNRWHPIVRSWYNSLKVSGQTQLWQASDWTTAVLAADSYDRFIRTGNGQVLMVFNRLSERLGATEIDRKRARIELTAAKEVDRDEQTADSAAISWKGRLGVVND